MPFHHSHTYLGRVGNQFLVAAGERGLRAFQVQSVLGQTSRKGWSSHVSAEGGSQTLSWRTSKKRGWIHPFCCLVLSFSFLWKEGPRLCPYLCSSEQHLLSSWKTSGGVRSWQRSPSLPNLKRDFYILNWCGADSLKIYLPVMVMFRFHPRAYTPSCSCGRQSSKLAPGSLSHRVYTPSPI